jgi:predicted amidohydrolase
MEELRISWIQSSLACQDVEANKENFERYFNSLSDTDVVVLPEMFTTGFSMEPHRFAESMNGDTVAWMQAQSKRLNAVLMGSIICKTDDGNHVNRLLWVEPGGAVKHYDKRHLFSFAGEDEHYTAGKDRICIEYKGWRIFPQICFDLRFPVWSRNDLNYDVAIYVANWPERRSYPWKQLLRARAIENQAYVLGVNRVGEDGNGINHSGDSVLLDALGEEVLVSPPHEQGSFTAILSKQCLMTIREKFRFLDERDHFTLLP